MLLEGRAAIVSGVGPGMGRSIALALAREGANVALGARTASTLDEVAAEVEALGRRALAVPTDITDAGACEALADAAAEAFDGIDVLVNNAFVQPPLETIEDNDISVWEDAFRINVFGTLQVTKAVLPHMKARASGSIVFINSMSIRRIRRNFGAYAATKSALMATAQTLAKEHGRDGIRVNSIVPGYIWEDKLKWWFGHQAEQRGVDPQIVYDEVASENPLHHLPTPDEIADAVLFFASDLSRVITGQALDVNAGHWFH
ncbi:MAG: SDR family oxidoreductase [Actinobacteria bacterium]|nr:SDR family oxidoreductase [Actinomycetota bacterium]